MTGSEFIKMMREDIETHKDKVSLSAVVDAMETVVNQNPFCEINAEDKTPEGCYNAMRDHAQKNKTGNSYCFSPAAAMKFISEYLGLTASAGEATRGGIVNLEDFI